MKKRKALLLLATSALSLGTIVSVFVAKRASFDPMKSGGDPTISITLDDSNGVTAENYAPTLETKEFVKGFVKINHLLVKKYDGGYAKIAPHGTIYNYTSDDSVYYGRITGIDSLTVDFTGGDLFYQVSRDLSGKIFTEKKPVTSQTTINLSALNPSYFILEAGDSELTVNSISITGSCHERENLNVAQLGKVYTGEKDGVVYKATIDNGTVNLVTINKDVNDAYTGTVSVNEGKVVFAIQGAGNLAFTPNEGRTKLTVDPSQGIGSMFTGLALNEVFNVEDFESYSGTGTGYDTDHLNFNGLSGLRSAFHVDYYNSKSSTYSLLQDKNWQLMPSGSNYLIHQSTGGVNDSAFALMQSHSNGSRHVSFSSLYNVPRTLGKGATFSFWAHGAIKTDFTTAANDLVIKVRTLHKNPITGVNDSNGALSQFTIKAGSDWTQYTIPLDSSKEYYGFSIYMQNSYNYYLPIDNIEIYTADPYATVQHNYVSFTGQGTLQGNSTFQSVFKINSTYFNFGISRDGTGFGYVLGQTFTISSYEIDENKVLTAEGTLTANDYDLTLTGLSGTFNDDYSVLSNVTLTGSAASYFTNNGSMTIDKTHIYETEDFEGATNQSLNDTFNRWYMTSDTWIEDTKNADAMNVYTEDGYDDNSCMRVRGYTKYSLTYDEFFSKEYHGMGFWVKNNTSKNLIAKYFSYTGSDFSSGAQMWKDDVTVPARSGWTLVIADFKDKMSLKTVTNIRFFFQMSSGTQTDYIYIDNIFYY